MNVSPFSLGRFGGAAVLVFGIALVLASIALWRGAPPAGVDRFGVIPLAALCFGAALVAAGIVSIRSAAPRHTMLRTRLAARELVTDKTPPFWVCTRCHAIADGESPGGCIECGSIVDCVEVATERERSTALAALGR